MARYPHAKYREVRGLSKDPAIIPVGVILHVSATMAPSLFGYFDGPSGGIESHLHVPLSEHDFTEQYRDTTREADANYRGNSWVKDGKRYGYLSVEAQGLASGTWSDHQVAEIVAFSRWAHAVHPTVPLKRATGVYSGGIGYHVQFGTGPGTWSNAVGKVCPGKARIEQYHDLILPAIVGKISVPAPRTPPTKAKVPGLRPEAAPRWPLPPGYYFGPRSGPRQSVSGYVSHRADLRVWQARMRARGWTIAVDGLYGPGTAAVVRKFQADKRLPTTGLIDARTWALAWTSPVT